MYGIEKRMYPLVELESLEIYKPSVNKNGYVIIKRILEYFSLPGHP
ncbi:MAG: hypothetical protein ABI416_00560 [Ginsengibacter sp.]